MSAADKLRAAAEALLLGGEEKRRQEMEAEAERIRQEAKKQGGEVMTTCGTRSGYQRHQDEDTPACPPCLAANSSAVKASRVRTGKTRSLYVDVDVLAQTLAAHPCDALLAFLGEEVAEAVMRAPKAIGEAA